MTLKSVIEALLFAARESLTVKDIKALLKEAAEFDPTELSQGLANAKEGHIADALAEIRTDLENAGRSYVLEEVAGGFQLASKPDYALWVKQLFENSKPQRLSAPALETLAIIAYRQPISRAEIEVVRGVSVDGVVGTLQERGLIKATGRAEVPGRPLIYETTDYFMEHFGLRDLNELPNSDELRRVPLAATGTVELAPELPLIDEPREPAQENRQSGSSDPEVAAPTA